ncbi:peptidyl-tRNA hydrolase [Thelonectria olida]|uniref:peptidyl-tRNA hydrolase n=1 Tax=Thelonectria olida TaxID=1576542 RepID=A0A9P9AQG5_9HYPO|nr:peptidyl-tRNA hydrolase [Thelonectria olida]
MRNIYTLWTLRRVTMFSPRFLVVSLGNPLPKYDSLHSAGHFALNGLAKVLRYPSFREITLGKQTCLVSQGPKYTLVQSPTLMNISGGFVARTWQEMAKQHDPASLSLVIVHDELEKEFGVVKLTAWDRSHKGHNGIKSVKGSLSQGKYPDSPFARIAIGIGRPAARDAETVSRYVLDRISDEKRKVLEEEAPWGVAEQLVELENEWRSEVQS